MSVFNAAELPKIQAYLERKFGTRGFALKMRERAQDSAEVLLNGEFLALVYKDDEDGEVSYDLNMAIFLEDL
jgi:hypothetical protein